MSRQIATEKLREVVDTFQKILVLSRGRSVQGDSQNSKGFGQPDHNGRESFMCDRELGDKMVKVTMPGNSCTMPYMLGV